MQDKFKNRRERLIANLIKGGYLKTPEIIETIRSIPRHLFVPESSKEHAYDDYPLPIPEGQTISAPHMISIILELLELKPTDQVLEIGAGSGYNAALLSKLAKKVTSLEFFPELVEFAKQNLKKAGVRNVTVLRGDGSKGMPDKKFDRIVFTCAVSALPDSLLTQLKDPGMLLAPVGSTDQQMLTLLRKEKGRIKKEEHGYCIFVPLRTG